MSATYGYTAHPRMTVDPLVDQFGAMIEGVAPLNDPPRQYAPGHPGRDPTVWGSSSFPLYRNTELRAITLSCGSCERLMIRLSAMPSLRYSVLGSPLTFTKGKTANESMALDFAYSSDRGLRRMIRSSRHSECGQGQTAQGTVWPVCLFRPQYLPESLSRLRFLRSIKSSRADW